MTANIITYRGRSGIRDIGKVLGFEKEELDKLSAVVSRMGLARQGRNGRRPVQAGAV